MLVATRLLPVPPHYNRLSIRAEILLPRILMVYQLSLILYSINMSAVRECNNMCDAKMIAYEQRSVQTSWGIVRGEVISPNGEDLPPVAQYLGVPYGVAPSGQFRFNMAISAAKWTHMPKDARRLAPVCIQTEMPELSETRAFKHTSAQRFDYVHRLLPKLKRQSEDCLYMNLFVPERLELRRYTLESSLRESPLPTMVLVHGDDYGWNAGNAYNGSILAAHGQMIVVTLNYRLGVYGFLGRCESSSCSGNSGISDLVSALTMLNVVLPSFGGDPRAVTLMGASLVSLLMASPLTQPGRRLFRRAVLLDGSALAPWAIAHNPQSYFMQLAERLGCVSQNHSSSFNDAVDTILRCMQDHSASNVTRAVQTIEVPSFLSGFAPIVDGQVGCFPTIFHNYVNYKRKTVMWISYPIIERHLILVDSKQSSRVFFCTIRITVPRDRSLKHLCAICTTTTDPKFLLLLQMNILIGIILRITCLFSQFQLYSGFNADDKGISKVMMYYLANFVKSGDPSKPSSIPKNFPMGEVFYSTAWPQFDEPNREAYLEITDRPRVRNFYRNAQVGFWTSLIPRLHQTGTEGGSVPEEHHFLPDHFKRDSFFGRVRPFAAFANHPFPPPPMPPSPPPENIKKTTTVVPHASSASSHCPRKLFDDPFDARRSIRQTFIQWCFPTYCSYCSCSTCDISWQSTEAFFSGTGEPLLSASHRTTTGMRPGVSPTCPRHGRAALALQSSRGNSLVSAGPAPTLEEIQKTEYWFQTHEIKEEHVFRIVCSNNEVHLLLYGTIATSSVIIFNREFLPYRDYPVLVLMRYFVRDDNNEISASIMVLLLMLIFSVSAQEWNPSLYPNPRKGGFKQCNMKSVSNVCDPDMVLTESERYRLHSELTRMTTRTEQSGNTFCDKKGVDAVLAISKQASQKFANSLNQIWNLDPQCKKSVVFVLSSDDRKLYMASGEHAGMDSAEFQAITSSQEVPLSSGSFTSALVNVFKEIGKKSVVEPELITPKAAAVLSLTISTFIICLL
uniref:COesterase domain-containing protein n=1 Tax=Heterorhabditis bacteriophora TaxID=37862 RepID=A0A1I7X5E6_HETBA